MNYFDSMEQKNNLSLNNPKDVKIIEEENYTKFLREQFTNEKVYLKDEPLENIFTNEIYYRAMKDMSKIEKQLLREVFLNEYTLEDISKKLRLTKAETIELKKTAIEHFKNLVRKYEKLQLNKKGGDCNEE